MVKKILILTISLIILTSYANAPEGLTFSTSLNKQDSISNPAKYSSEEELIWNYGLSNEGKLFDTSVCFYLRSIDYDKMIDITNEPILKRANKQYGCVDDNNIPITNAPLIVPLHLTIKELVLQVKK